MPQLSPENEKKSSNPALSQKAFEQAGVAAFGEEAMSVQGTVNKTFIYLTLVIAAAAYIWKMYAQQGAAAIMPWLLGAGIAAFVVALITIFNRKAAVITGSLYAALQGVVVGGLSAIFESMYTGIVLQAVMLTFGVMFMMLFLYTSRIIKVTQGFKMGVVAATGAVMLVYLASFILGFFNINVPYIGFGEKGMISIVVSIVIVIIAAMNLVLDFNFIESASEARAPKYMEWYAAFGLMVTLLWLYIEALKLLTKLRSK